MKTILCLAFATVYFLYSTDVSAEYRGIVYLTAPQPKYGTIEQGILDRVTWATCRVNRASGIVFAVDQEYYWIMSAGHVVLDDNNKKEPVFVEFFYSGHSSEKMKAELLWAKDDPQNITADLCVIKLKKDKLLNYPAPIPIPLAKKDFIVHQNQLVYSCGCPRGEWPSAWKGHVYWSGDTSFKVIPTAIGGRSGSGVCMLNKDGTIMLVGITVRTDGRAISTQQIYNLTQWSER